jgi:hypothetical protein
VATRRRTHRIAHAVAVVLAGCAFSAPVAAAEQHARDDRDGAWPERTVAVLVIAAVAAGEAIAFLRRRGQTL